MFLFGFLEAKQRSVAQCDNNVMRALSLYSSFFLWSIFVKYIWPSSLAWRNNKRWTLFEFLRGFPFLCLTCGVGNAWFVDDPPGHRVSDHDRRDFHAPIPPSAPLYYPEPAITSFQSLQLTVNLFRTKLLEYAPIFRFSPAWISTK